jgi:hypothetical protein
MILFLLAVMLLVGCGQANQKQPEDRRKNTQCSAFIELHIHITLSYVLLMYYSIQ